MNEVLVWSICFASLAALVYLMTPIIVRFDQKYRAKPTLYPVVVAELSHAAAEYLGGCGQALEAESFSTVGYYSLSLNTANVHTYIGLFMNRANDVKAIVAAFYIKTEDGIKITTRTVEFITHWKDGVEISTNKLHVAASCAVLHASRGCAGRHRVQNSSICCTCKVL